MAQQGFLPCELARENRIPFGSPKSTAKRKMGPDTCCVLRSMLGGPYQITAVWSNMDVLNQDSYHATS